MLIWGEKVHLNNTVPSSLEQPWNLGNAVSTKKTVCFEGNKFPHFNLPSVWAGIQEGGPKKVIWMRILKKPSFLTPPLSCLIPDFKKWGMKVIFSRLCLKNGANSLAESQKVSLKKKGKLRTYWPCSGATGNTTSCYMNNPRKPPISHLSSARGKIHP